ncbi:MAG: DUF2238 domain-containing protein [Steroidobacteraceae bacterium]
MRSPDRVPAMMLATFAVVWVALAIAPLYRQDWLLENVIVLVALPLFVAGYRRLRFSNLAYACLFAFLVLHEIGAHYTYSEVPWREWWMALGGPPPASGRNHYDRLVHFSYGLLLLPVARELHEQRAPSRRPWAWLLPLLFLMSHSVIYELVEWQAAEVFGGDLGAAYLGTQGDPWDAQKDMAMAALGALAGTLLYALRPRREPARPPG